MKSPMLIGIAACATALASPAGGVEGGFNYAEALQKCLYFFEAQQSCTLSPSNRVEWRGPACLADGQDIGRDLSGGWFDAGDHWTANLTLSFAAMAAAMAASSMIIREHATALKGKNGDGDLNGAAFALNGAAFADLLLDRAEKLVLFTRANSGPVVTDKLPQVEQDAIYPGNMNLASRIVKLRLTAPDWSAANDWSAKELEENPKLVPRFAVYEGGRLIAGEDPPPPHEVAYRSSGAPHYCVHRTARVRPKREGRFSSPAHRPGASHGRQHPRSLWRAATESAPHGCQYSADSSLEPSS